MLLITQNNFNSMKIAFRSVKLITELILSISMCVFLLEIFNVTKVILTLSKPLLVMHLQNLQGYLKQER